MRTYSETEWFDAEIDGDGILYLTGRAECDEGGGHFDIEARVDLEKIDLDIESTFVKNERG